MADSNDMQARFDAAVRDQDVKTMVDILKEDTEHSLSVDLPIYQNNVTPLFGCIGAAHVLPELAEMLLVRGAKRDTCSSKNITLKEHVIQSMDYWEGHGYAEDGMWDKGVTVYQLLAEGCALTPAEKDWILTHANCAREKLLQLAGLNEPPSVVALRSAVRDRKWAEAIKAVEADAKIDLNAIDVDLSTLATSIFMSLSEGVSPNHVLIQQLLSTLVAKGLDTTRSNLLKPIDLFLTWLGSQPKSDATFVVAIAYWDLLEQGGVSKKTLRDEAKSVVGLVTKDISRLLTSSK